MFGDFRAFYCAGELVRQHAFSYAESAIAPCESVSLPGFYTASSATVVPAPLPGYLAALFVPFSLLPFPLACAAWTAFSVACVFAAFAVLARLGWARFDTAVVASAILLGTAVLVQGELSSVALLGIALVIYGCERDRAALRVAGLVLAFAEPQIALGVAAVLAARRRTLFEVFAVVVGLFALSLVTIGWSANVAYLQDFLPAHVAAELARAQQYTLSWAFAQLGASPAVALWCGRVFFAAALAAAYWCGRRGRPEIAVAGGAALALAFGPFVHLDHLICALPAAFVAAREIRIAGALALLLVALPVTAIFAQPLLLLAVPVVVFWVLVSFGISSRAATYGALAGVMTGAAFAVVSVRLGFNFSAGRASGGAWATYIARHEVVTGLLIWIVKAPVWIGLASIAVVAAALAVRSEFGSAARHIR